ncbi:hypothetical protein TorRG33x02_209790, partial [Trema orientale]
MTWQLLRKCLYAWGLSNLRTTDQTVATGASIAWTTLEQHWLGPTECAWWSATDSGTAKYFAAGTMWDCLWQLTEPPVPAMAVGLFGGLILWSWSEEGIVFFLGGV